MILSFFPLSVPSVISCSKRFGCGSAALRSSRLCVLDNCRIYMPPLSQFKRFDIRDLLRRGVEPFPEIRQRVDALKANEGLLVVAPFLPSPLIEKLASEGFASKVERGP